MIIAIVSYLYPLVTLIFYPLFWRHKYILWVRLCLALDMWESARWGGVLEAFLVLHWGAGARFNCSPCVLGVQGPCKSSDFRRSKLIKGKGEEAEEKWEATKSFPTSTQVSSPGSPWMKTSCNHFSWCIVKLCYLETPSTDIGIMQVSMKPKTVCTRTFDSFWQWVSNMACLFFLL